MLILTLEQVKQVKIEQIRILLNIYLRRLYRRSDHFQAKNLNKHTKN